MALNASIAILGVCLLGFASNTGARYLGVFLAAAGANANLPANLTYQATNIRGQWKRAFATASVIGWSGVGGIVGPLVFRSQDAPHYFPGLVTVLVADMCVLITTAVLTVLLRRANKAADKGEGLVEGLQGFRYTL